MKHWLTRWMLAMLLTVTRALAAPAASPADYRFAPGDVLEVTVAPQHTYDRTITVQPDGKVSYPIVGQIEAAGLTVEQLVQKIRDGLNQDLVDPLVTISLREASKREVGRVSLLGAVHTQGGIEIKAGTTVAEALAASGGATPVADLRRVTITRADGTVITVDASQTDQTGRVDKSVILLPGDILVVPEGARPTVLVLGEVAKPGSFEIARDARLLDAISQAGGLTEKADVHRVTLARPGEAAPRSLDLQPLLAKGDTSNQALNVTLQPGDTIFIAPTEQQIYVVGAVSKPGLYPIKPNDRVLDVLVSAGGAGAGSSRAVLVRRDAQGKAMSKNLDLKKIMEKGDRAENELLRPGDVLFVPDRKQHRSFLDSLSLLYPLTYLFSFAHP